MSRLDRVEVRLIVQLSHITALMAVMCGLCLSVHVLKLPQAFMLSPELLLFRQVECEIKGFVLSGVYLTPQYLASQFPL
ncbi:MAG: hypothetical protein KJ868_13135 [Gammaproteobacteria bacterium]|nr:hypothetical protein [Gammaproteobacteria bacterium]MBU2238945.1 hypothetical protein [Gammaproteobacteria bacterium]